MLTLKKHRGVYTIHDSSLRTGWTMRQGEIRTPDGTWTVTATDRHRIGITAKASGATVVRLHPQQTVVPGPGGPSQWTIGHNRGTLTRDGNRLSVRQSPRPYGLVRIEVTGTWPALDLVLLTACFAVMSRRRLRTLTILAIVGATGHGPV